MKQENKLIQFCREIGMTDDDITLFFTFLQPIMTNYLNILFSTYLSDAEVYHLEKKFKENNYTFDQELEAMSIALEMKSGKTVEQYYDDFIEGLASQVEEDMNKFKKIALMAKDNAGDDEDKFEEELKGYTDILIHKKLKELETAVQK